MIFSTIISFILQLKFFFLEIDIIDIIGNRFLKDVVLTLIYSRHYSLCFLDITIIQSITLMTWKSFDIHTSQGRQFFKTVLY